MSRRSRQPPSLSRAAKSSLDAALHPHIDSALKQLKSCARSLQLVLSTFSDELQILHRLYYKGKNQHRPALFWRRVTEMRRYADRVEELSLLPLVDSLRYSFFGEEAQQNSKLLKGSWTHYPDPSSLSFFLERIGASLSLVQKMHERLAHAYESFSLAMQTGAFIQLILTLAGIASRMSSLVSELVQALKLTEDAVHRILVTLDPTHDWRSRRQTPPDPSSSAMLASVVPVSTDVYEDTGVSIPRQDPQPEVRAPLPSPYTDTPHEDVPIHAAQNPAPLDDIPSLAASSAVVERKTLVKKVKRAVESSPGQAKPKRRKRDEIDDIFG